MNWLKRVLGDVVAVLQRYFSTGKAAQDAKWVLEHTPAALPYIGQCVTVLTALTPTGVDDLIWNSIKTRYPQFFDGTLKTEDELKAAALVAASELFARQFGVSTSVARSTVSLAYLDYKAAPK